ncbi:tripartite tricarboxylate transporter substrate binding protein [Roseococcus sp. SYP-B2431]|uniref:Bug family tripartite tricarboxylate transporter substrate binding protein n=1 Tax=Roseococcus sp. SYP-B2431 TaxID=2496640 RepID=UPI00103EB683|nr:tripartite tricarboxylate transporter substrate-binding protein [Roseococcus sp. SYP-B2431]TCI00664.1 tripartite tricarboxylate transporter substrate binding protein [Roseococcus sp. SYP-B2431]
MRRRAFLAAPALIVAPAIAQSPATGAWPTGPIRIVSPFTPGGASDLMGRFAGQAIQAALGVNVVVENRPGAGGNVGMESVARSAPDGQTFVVTAAAAAINQSLYRGLSFDLLRDFAPVTVVAMVPNVLSVHPSAPVRTAPEFVAWAKSRRGGITYGSAGVGTHPHLAMALFCRRAGIEAVHVPFRGSAPAVTELIAGRLDAVFENLPPQTAHLRAGSLRGLAVSSAERHPDFPDLPPLGEVMGWPGFAPVAWQSLMAPAGTPAPVLERVAAIIAAALRVEENAARIRSMGALPSGMPPAAFRAFLAAEVASLGEAVRISGAVVE